MKQTIYLVVKRQFCKDKLEGAWIVSTHYNSLDAMLATHQEYNTMAEHEARTYAEWSEFGGLRGLVRYNNGYSWSIYMKEIEVEL